MSGRSLLNVASFRTNMSNNPNVNYRSDCFDCMLLDSYTPFADLLIACSNKELRNLRAIEF